MRDWRNFGRCYRISEKGEIQSNHTGVWKDKKLKKSKSDQRGGFYMTFSITGRHVRVHRLMWEIFRGYIPKGMVIDHIDGNRENNSLCNLRCVTQKENIQNLKDRGNFKGFARRGA